MEGRRCWELEQKKPGWKLTKKKRERLKDVYIRAKRVKEQYRRKMNKDVNGNRILFWKGVSKANGGKVESAAG